MSDSVFRNYIAGEWVEGNTSLANISPADTSDLLGHYAQRPSPPLRKVKWNGPRAAWSNATRS